MTAGTGVVAEPDLQGSLPGGHFSPQEALQMKISICIAAIALAATAAAADDVAPAYSVRTLPSLGGGAAGASSINQGGWVSGAPVAA